MRRNFFDVAYSSGYKEGVHNQCLTGTPFFNDSIQVSVIMISHFLMPSGVWIFDDVCVFDTIWVYIPSMNLHTQVNLNLPEYQYGLEWY